MKICIIELMPYPFTIGGGSTHLRDLSRALVEDRHYFLFVQSHLDALFSKFRERNYKYVSVGRNKIINYFLRMLPFHLGAIHLEMEAVK
jgi:glycosyltransferase involved in cell wall biosynthesis